LSTRARKDRKKAGIAFTKPQKIGTPIAERAWFNAIFPNPAKNPPANKLLLVRSEKKRNRALQDRGLLPPTVKIKEN